MFTPLVLSRLEIAEDGAAFSLHARYTAVTFRIDLRRENEIFTSSVVCHRFQIFLANHTQKQN